MNLYDLLGVERDATPAQIRAAYRAKAKSAHPDTEGGSAEAFRALREAFDVLTDARRRERYDRTGDFTSDIDAEDRMAVSLIRELVDAMVEQFTEHTTDPIQTMCRVIDTNISEIPRHIRRLEKKKANAEALLKRFTSKGKSRVILTLLEAKISAIATETASQQTRLRVMKRAREIILDHEFTVDDTKDVEGVWRTFTGSGGFIFKGTTST